MEHCSHVYNHRNFCILHIVGIVSEVVHVIHSLGSDQSSAPTRTDMFEKFPFPEKNEGKKNMGVNQSEHEASTASVKRANMR